MRLISVIQSFSHFARSAKVTSRKAQILSVAVGGTAVLGAYSTFFVPFKVHAAKIASSIDTSAFMDAPITNLEIIENSKDNFRTRMELLIMKVQADFCHALEKEETKGTKFLVDRWSRINPKEGGGITCVLQDGEVFEKAGVSITVMSAPLSKRLLQSMRARGKDLPDAGKYSFFAAGVSSVIHPRNPHVPTVHFNYRYFEIQDENGVSKDWWYGGGTDLTPYYLDEKDVKHFHESLKKPCDKFRKDAYDVFKDYCDAYFYNDAREECRGVGGIFFDDLTGDQEEVFKFVQSASESVVPSYIPIVQKNKGKKYTDLQRRWQLLRRGRYVEFNLLYDRGTKFGFNTPGARIESILMSLPLLASWEYMHKPEKGSEEDKLLEVLIEPKKWA